MLGPVIRVGEAVCVLLVAAIPLVLFAGTVGRYTGWYGLPWVSEVARLFLVWLTFLGGGVAAAHRAHLRIGLLDSRLSDLRRLAVLRAATHACVVVAGILLVILGMKLIGLRFGGTTVVLGLPRTWAYGAMPIAGFYFILFGLVDFVEACRAARRAQA